MHNSGRIKKFSLVIYLYVCAYMTLYSQVNILQIKNNGNFLNQTISVYFRFNKSEIEKDYRTNNDSFRKLDEMLSEFNIRTIDSITITSFASVEGNEIYNKNLTQKRSDALCNFLIRRYPYLQNKIQIRLRAEGENWEELLKQAYERKWIPHREWLINLLENQRLSNQEKEKRIREKGGGEVYKYLNKYIFGELRKSASIVLWQKRKVEQLPAPNLSGRLFIPAKQYSYFDSNVKWLINRPEQKSIQKSLFALKSNLLFDAVTAFNAEVEVPVSRNISVAGEWIFPFWKNRHADLTFQVLYGGLDLKYWLHQKGKAERMTGWFCDLYGGVGKYDIQPFSKYGVQGKLLNVGAGAGFAHSIAKNLRLEYSLGIGYIRSDYHKYDFVSDTQYGEIKVVRYPWKRFIYNGFGPSKAKISLVWMIKGRSGK